MKLKRIVTVAGCNLLLCSFLPAGFHSVCSSGCDYTSIVAAISAAAAGDTIFINTSTHTEAGMTITKNLTFLGSSANSNTIQAHASEQSASNRLFTVNSGVTAKFEELTLANGYVPAGNGGCITNAGTLTLSKCYIKNNWINGEGSYYGAGIYNSGSLTVESSTFYRNHTDWPSGEGGGIFNDGTATVINSTFYYNGSLEGSGLSNHGTATIVNSTFYKNFRWNYGGAVFNDNAGTIYLKNNLMAGSMNGSEQTIGDDYNNWGGTETTEYNVIESANGWVTGTGDKHAETATPIYVSSTLELNNSVYGTPTLKTSAGSININNGDTLAFNGVSIPHSDQRGAVRNGTFDIGSYEYFDDEGSLPVSLSSFTSGWIDGSSIQIRWTTESEMENLGFILERRSQSAIWTEIAHFREDGSLRGQGSTSAQTDYSYLDQTVQYGKPYEYRLADVNYQGYRVYHYQIAEGGDSKVIKPHCFKLTQNYPNPFNPSTTISYGLPENLNVSLVIYDVRGQVVQTFESAHQSAGWYNVVWKGETANGKTISTGIYFARLVAGEHSEVIKMLMVK